MMHSDLDLTISIVNHSNPDLLRDCLRSIYSSTTNLNFDIWVIDNATDGRLLPELRVEFPKVIWIMNDRRKGFSANHNQVLAKASARYVLILNDDTIVHPDAFKILVEFLDAHSDSAIAAPRLLNPDGSIQTSTFYFMTLTSELVDICLLPRALAHLKKIGINSAQFGELPKEIDWGLGACLAVRTAAIAEFGLLDDVMSPVANTEEVDWCYRAKQYGWKVMFVPAARVTHIGGQSMKADNDAPPVADRFRVEMYRTRLVFFHKHYGLLQAFLLRAIYFFTLPFNLLMLRQSYLRRRLSFDKRSIHAATLRQIASLSLRPSRYVGGK